MDGNSALKLKFYRGIIEKESEHNGADDTNLFVIWRHLKVWRYGFSFVSNKAKKIGNEVALSFPET